MRAAQRQPARSFHFRVDFDGLLVVGGAVGFVEFDEFELEAGDVPGVPADAGPATVEAGRNGASVAADAGGSVVVVVPGGHDVGGGITTVGTGYRSSIRDRRTDFAGAVWGGSAPDTRALPIACSSIGCV